MNYILDLTVCAGLISLFCNIGFYLYLRQIGRIHDSKVADLSKAHADQLEKEKKKPQITEDARAILADLTSGPALVKIEYLDRSEVFLRSPRNM